MHTAYLRLLQFSIFCCAVSAAHGADYSISGFGTLGYVRSDRNYSYQRFISSHGSIRRDSVIGIQFDATIGRDIGATLQVLAGPADDSDSRDRASIAWAFVSWRPSNDVLVRVGRQRIPLYLYSQSFNVGVTFPFARLPTEMYSISPSNEFNGLSVSRSWEHELGDMTVDAYWGSSVLDVRFWMRDSIPLIQRSGALFRDLAVEGGGFVLSVRRKESVYRVGASRVRVHERGVSNSYPVTYPFVPLGPGVGYYQVSSTLPGPGVPTIDHYSFRTVTLGADVDVGHGFRTAVEVAKSYVSDTLFASQSTRGYFSLARPMGKFTPYIAVAFLRSDSDVVSLHQAVNYAVVPAIIPGSAQINASQRAGADNLFAFDQRSLAVGTSYSLTPTSKIKAELMRVRIGKVSSLVDGPPGSNIRNETINVISLSYSVVF